MRTEFNITLQELDKYFLANKTPIVLYLYKGNGEYYTVENPIVEKNTLITSTTNYNIKHGTITLLTTSPFFEKRLSDVYIKTLIKQYKDEIKCAMDDFMKNYIKDHAPNKPWYIENFMKGEFKSSSINPDYFFQDFYGKVDDFINELNLLKNNSSCMAFVTEYDPDLSIIKDLAEDEYKCYDITPSILAFRVARKGIMDFLYNMKTELLNEFNDCINAY